MSKLIQSCASDPLCKPSSTKCTFGGSFLVNGVFEGAKTSFKHLEETPWKENTKHEECRGMSEICLQTQGDYTIIQHQLRSDYPRCRVQYTSLGALNLPLPRAKRTWLLPCVLITCLATPECRVLWMFLFLHVVLWNLLLLRRHRSLLSYRHCAVPTFSTPLFQDCSSFVDLPFIVKIQLLMYVS